MTNNFEYKIAGVDNEEKIIALIADELYGSYTMSFDIEDMDKDTYQLKVNYDFSSNNEVPVTRQEQVLEHIVTNILLEITKDLNEK